MVLEKLTTPNIYITRDVCNLSLCVTSCIYKILENITIKCRFSNLFEIVLTFITQNLVSFTRNLSCPNWRFNHFKRCLSSSEFYYGPNGSHTFTRIFLTVWRGVMPYYMFYPVNLVIEPHSLLLIFTSNIFCATGGLNSTYSCHQK